MADPELTQIQKCQLAGIEKFLGDRLQYRGAEMSNGYLKQNFGVDGRPDIAVNTSNFRTHSPDGAISSQLVVTRPDGTVQQDSITNVRVMGSKEPFQSDTEHVTKGAGVDKSAAIYDGVSRPISDDPEHYSPATNEQMRFHKETTASCNAPVAQNAADVVKTASSAKNLPKLSV
jgi:hypothetical protein